jgi:hypothetical protein
LLIIREIGFCETQSPAFGGTDMAIAIQGGWLNGRLIRRARKPLACNDYRHCRTMIQAGDYYAEMEVDPDLASGYGMKKLCMNCAGEEARATLENLSVM